MRPNLRRYVWKVEHETGEVEFVRFFSAAHQVGRRPGLARRWRRFIRLGAGRYCYIEPVPTPAGPRPTLVMVTRVRASAADVKHLPLLFDAGGARDLLWLVKDRDGL